MRISHLSHHDTVTLLEMIHDSVICTDEDQLRQVMARLRELLPYQAGLSCIARLDHGRPADMRVINVDYPNDYLAELARRQLVMDDPIVRENFKTFRLQYWADTFHQTTFTPRTNKIISLAEDYGFSSTSRGCGYGYGIRDSQGRAASFFCYHGLERSNRTEEILTLIAPHFHQALVRTKGAKARRQPEITPREREILQWLAHGKSSWDIAAILHISERTVKFHVGNILQKLDASTRAHAVAIAFEQGWLEVM